MRGLLGTIATCLAIVLLGTATPAMAASATKCDIGFTGPDSHNMCTSVTKYTCQVTNTNTVTITNDNNQEVASGAVTTSGNTSGGQAVSGTVTNTNGTTFQVTVTNSSPNVNNDTCSALLVVPATTVPQKTVKPEKTTKSPVKTLPFTGAGTTLQDLAVVAGGAVALTVLGAGSVAWYRWRK